MSSPSSGEQHIPFLVEDFVTLAERSQAAPAVASWKESSYIAWTGRDCRLNVMSSVDGRRFENKRTFSYQSCQTISLPSPTFGSHPVTYRNPPSLSGGRDGLVLAWRGADRYLHTSTFPFGHGGSAVEATINQSSADALATAALGSQLALAWRTYQRPKDLIVSRLRLSVSEGGRFLTAVPLRILTRRPPAICAAGNQVVLAWTRTDRHINVVFSPLGPSPMLLRVDAKSSHAPALSSFGDDVLLAWTGTDGHINLAVIRSQRVYRSLRLKQTTYCSPAVCSYLGALLLAWTGRNARLNIALLSRNRLEAIMRGLI